MLGDTWSITAGGVITTGSDPGYWYCVDEPSASGNAGGVGRTRPAPQPISIVNNSTNPSNGTKNQGCSVLDPNCKPPNKILQYVTFLGCEFNSDIEQLTDEEDAQHPTQIPIVFSAIATVGGLTGKVPGWSGITGAVTGSIYTIGIAAKSNQECTESVYGY